MSSRLNQTVGRFNGAHPEMFMSDESHRTLSGSGVSHHTTVPGSIVPPHQSHRGHRRGHSYGGPSNPPSASLHHALEHRPSHPNGHYHASTLSGGQSSALQKGHRRALSGCLPMVGMGAVAWSSLRDLESKSTTIALASRALSPDVFADSRPSSPEISHPPSKLASKSNTLEKKKDALETGDSLHSMECGIGPCLLPQCFNKLANIKFFVVILALLVTLQQAVASGYVNSVITTIEARFEIPSRFSGIVASCYEMGNVCTVLFVSYLGAKRHIPRWIATGVMVMVVGCIVFTLPHFLSSDRPPPNHKAVQQQHLNPSSQLLTNTTNRLNDTDSNLNYSLYNTSSLNYGDPISRRNSFCNAAYPQSSKYIGSGKVLSNIDLESAFSPSDDSNTDKKDFTTVTRGMEGCVVEEVITEEDGTATKKTSMKVSEESFGHPIILFMIAQLLLGCGGSPLFTLGVTFVDDHVPKESSSIYIGVIYAMAAFGPVLGFLLGAWLLLIPSSLTEVVNPDTQFIGMWYGGFLIVGGLLFLVTLPFLTFPKFLHNPNEELNEDEVENELEQKKSKSEEQFTAIEPISEESQTSEEPLPPPPKTHEYGQSIKDIPRSILRLITNPTYVVTCLGGCMELNIVSGFIVFLPKYLETQFSMGKSQASVYTGGIAIPGACFGIIVGGYLVKRLKLKPSGAARFVVTTNCLCLVGYVLFFFLGCSNPNLAGATIPYPGSSESPGYHAFDVNLTHDCNADCFCDSSIEPQYVCHEGVTFYSPCHAGCSYNLTQCSCANNENVTLGACPEEHPCNTLAAFMITLFFMTGTVAVTQMPLLMIVLRSVSVEERSFALGMQFVIFRLLGYIPSPIIFGNVIDSACLLWSVKRCSTILPAVSGRCLLYDVQDFRYKYVGVLSGLKLIALALFLYDFFHLRKIEKLEEREETEAALALEAENLKLKSSSVVSLAKLFQDDPGMNGSAGTGGNSSDNPDGGEGALEEQHSIATMTTDLQENSSTNLLNNKS